LKQLDGYGPAIIGPAFIWNGNERVQVLVYNAEAIRWILQRRDGMSAEEAREYIESSIESAYVGPDTPVLAWPEDSFSLTYDA
jgi:hypothetical protein